MFRQLNPGFAAAAVERGVVVAGRRSRRIRAHVVQDLVGQLSRLAAQIRAVVRVRGVQHELGDAEQPDAQDHERDQYLDDREARCAAATADRLEAR